jgi:hypothetical protein
MPAIVMARAIAAHDQPLCCGQGFDLIIGRGALEGHVVNRLGEIQSVTLAFLLLEFQLPNRNLDKVKFGSSAQC